jgi:DNA polymerase-3 subunit epsilon
MNVRYGDRSTDEFETTKHTKHTKISGEEVWFSGVWCISWFLVSWIDQPIFFVDFEGSRTSGILEYGVVTVLRGAVVDAHTRLCRPTGRVRPEDTAVHGLKAATLVERAPFAEEWDFFAGLRESGPLAAHYAGVENALLKSVWPYPRRSPDFARPGEWIIDWGPWIDSARLCAQLFPALESGRLESVVTACGLDDELNRAAAAHCPPGRRRYHCALYDALAGALLLARLARDPQLAGLSLLQLLTLSTLDPVKRDALQQGELF